MDTETGKVRLTDLASCGGCAAKYSAARLEELLQGFVPERSKIFPRRISGTCSKHQRKVMRAIKRARSLALIPFTSD